MYSSKSSIFAYFGPLLLDYPYACFVSDAGLDMPQDVPKVSLSRTFSFPHRLAPGADELKAWATTIKADLVPLSGPR